MKIGELKKHGDFGLGTFNKPVGEMIVLDHVVCRLAPEGKIMQPDTEVFSQASFRSEAVNYR